MYYEVLDDIVYGYEKNKTLTEISLVNKSYLDSFFDLRSVLHRKRPIEEELYQFVQKNHAYLYYQKLIHGVCKSTFLGFNLFNLKGDIFSESGRLKVPEHDLELHLGEPCLFFISDQQFNFQSSQFQKWEDEVFKIQDSINSLLKVQITREGFRANLYRTLEIIYSMRSSATKRRTNWTVFLHELIIQQRSFDRSEIETRFGFQLGSCGNAFKLTDLLFPTQKYLEFDHHKSLGMISTFSIAETLDLGDQRNPMETFSRLNRRLLGKIPLCHFYLNEHMFVYKEEFEFNHYYDLFVKAWTEDKKIKIHFKENETGLEKSLAIDQFAKELREKKYSLTYGFSSDETQICFSAEPKMLKDLSRA
jgi:hypothetical protein